MCLCFFHLYMILGVWFWCDKVFFSLREMKLLRNVYLFFEQAHGLVHQIAICKTEHLPLNSAIIKTSEEDGSETVSEIYGLPRVWHTGIHLSPHLWLQTDQTACKCPPTGWQVRFPDHRQDESLVSFCLWAPVALSPSCPCFFRSASILLQPLLLFRTCPTPFFPLLALLVFFCFF